MTKNPSEAKVSHGTRSSIATKRLLFKIQRTRIRLSQVPKETTEEQRVNMEKSK